jgi:hypothetical protein
MRVYLSLCERVNFWIVGQFEFALKGHGFSRAVRIVFSSRLLAAEEMLFQTEPFTSFYFFGA